MALFTSTKYSLTLGITLIILGLSSCGNTIEDQIIKDWQVSKMERMEKAISIHSKMSYQFNADHTVQIITQIGNALVGTWKVNDQTITINVQGESKVFRIEKLTDKELILSSGEFQFYLKN